MPGLPQVQLTKNQQNKIKKKQNKEKAKKEDIDEANFEFEDVDDNVKPEENKKVNAYIAKLEASTAQNTGGKRKNSPKSDASDRRVKNRS